jgi:hypothetical protein
MARTAARLTDGSRITDHISLGVVAKTFPRPLIEEILKRTGRESARQRDLPAHVVVYYNIALALFMEVSYREVLRALLEGLQWLRDEVIEPKVAVRSSISQARIRLGWEPMRELHDEVVKPIATEATKGAWYRQWRIVSLDGSTLDIPDEAENRKAFGKHETPRGETAFPQIRFVGLVENGTHVIFGSRVASIDVGEQTLVEEVLPMLKPGMLCLADRGFNGYPLWNLAKSTGADLVWRLRKDLVFPREKELPDGSYLSTLHPSRKDRMARRDGTPVRIVEYTLEGIPDAEPSYRVMTTILDPEQAPATELAALYHERWEIESAFDELKTHLRGRQITLRSKTPDLVRQEFYGLLMAHFAIRGLIHEAALKGDVDPDRLSFIHAVRVVRRKMTRFASLPPSGPPGLPRKRAAGNPG